MNFTDDDLNQTLQNIINPTEISEERLNSDFYNKLFESLHQLENNDIISTCIGDLYE